MRTHLSSIVCMYVRYVCSANSSTCTYTFVCICIAGVKYSWQVHAACHLVVEEEERGFSWVLRVVDSRLLVVSPYTKYQTHIHCTIFVTVSCHT